VRGEQRPANCICLTGPTASGKTTIALELADQLGAEIVSMDSAMVYKGMDIGTDKPSQLTRSRVAHHLIDIRAPESTYSAGAFAVDAALAIRAIQARNRIALIVGGTLLYLRALRDGLANLPERDPSVRTAIDLEANVRGWSALHAELAEIDPPAAARIDSSDRQRIQRALEVFRLTGRTITELQSATGRIGGIDLPTIALVPSDRQHLKEQIEKRFDAMVSAGLVDEVRILRERSGLESDSPSMRAVGYRQVWAHLSGETNWATARERAIVATRQLAKRQLTWLRSDLASLKLESAGSDVAARVKIEIQSRLKL
jgi:tRNA dimethylallyltransferase